MVEMEQKMKALIETYNNNRIAQIESDERIFQVVPTLKWVDCPDDCQMDWSYCDGQFIRPDAAVLATEVVQNMPSPQTRNVMDEKATGQKDELLFSHSNAVNTNAVLVAEAVVGTAWLDAVCVKCYELMDIVKSGDMRKPSQEEQLVMLSVLKWLREFAEGKTAS